MTQNIDSYFENGKGFNPWLHREGYLTNDERKEPFRYYGENFVFFSKTADLSEPLEIYRNAVKNYPDLYYRSWEDAFMKDLMLFSMWWYMNVCKYLNGFSGIDSIRIDVDDSLGFKLNDLQIPMFSH